MNCVIIIMYRGNQIKKLSQDVEMNNKSILHLHQLCLPITLYYTAMREQRDDDQQTKNFRHDNGQGREPVKILGRELQRVQHFFKVYRFKRGGDMRHGNINYTDSAAWGNWNRCSGVLCDKRMPMKLNGKVYKTVVRSTWLYGAETWATTTRQEARL